jgi:hypothetical protein
MPNLGFYACASHLPVVKSLIPGGELHVDGTRISPSVEKTKDCIVLFFYLYRVFVVKIQAYFLFPFYKGLGCKIYPPL